MEVFQNMLNFLNMKDFIKEEDGSKDLDSPFNMAENDQQLVIQRELKLRQKFMRELRVIEAVVEYLHVPFASGAFKLENLKQDSSITLLCTLAY